MPVHVGPKPKVITEGKTKKLLTLAEYMAALVTNDNVSKGDGAVIEVIPGIGVHKTTQCSDLMGIVNRNIETAFIERINDNTMKVELCDTIPLEVVVRRILFGSAVARYPDLAPLYRFSEPKVELFYKLTVVSAPLVDTPQIMAESEAREKYLGADGKFPDGVYTDPLIIPNAKTGMWDIFSAKGAPKKVLISIAPLVTDEQVAEVAGQAKTAFTVLEDAFFNYNDYQNKIDCLTLVDFKIEFGRRKRDGKLVIADVIDGDSMRLWVNGDSKQNRDKQGFRDGNKNHQQILEDYAHLAQITTQMAGNA